jgi:hypothetical protein
MSHLLRRVVYATTRPEFEALLDSQSPARHELRDAELVALEKYTFTKVGPLFFKSDAPPARDHFLPHTGLWLDRPLPDPRMQTQLWSHTAYHNWYGMPLPVEGLAEYTRANFEAEIMAVIGSEFDFFKRFPTARSMFNSNFVSTYDAFHAVGLDSTALAKGCMMRMQFNGGRIPLDVSTHPAFKGGVAVTLSRQAAWAEHDTAWCKANFEAQQSEQFKSVYTNLWRFDDHGVIHERIAAGAEGLLRWSSLNDYDENSAKHAVTVSMVRVLGLELARVNAVDDDVLAKLIELRECDEPESVLDFADKMAEKHGILQDPMPLWDVATTFHPFRLQWEQELRAKTAQWAQSL